MKKRLVHCVRVCKCHNWADASTYFCVCTQEHICVFVCVTGRTLRMAFGLVAVRDRGALTQSSAGGGRLKLVPHFSSLIGLNERVDS